MTNNITSADLNYPLPWVAKEFDDGYIRSANGKVVMMINFREERDFIVKACNCHDELLEACKHSMRYLEQINNIHNPLYIQLQQAISKAEGK